MSLQVDDRQSLASLISLCVDLRFLHTVILILKSFCRQTHQISMSPRSFLFGNTVFHDIITAGT